MYFDLFIYFVKLKFLLCSLFSRFFNAPTGSNSSMHLIIKLKLRRIKNNWFSLLEDCSPFCSCSIFNSWNKSIMAQGIIRIRALISSVYIKK